MAAKKHKILTLSFDDDYSDYFLLGIQTPLKGHRLAYLLNNTLQLQLRKNEIDLVLTTKQGESKFITYDFIDKENYTNWSLITNIFKSLHIDKNLFDLFATEPFYSTKIDYFLPEEKEVNFLLRIEADTDFDFEGITAIIRKIYNIELVKPIDIDSLKNKQNIIF